LRYRAHGASTWTTVRMTQARPGVWQATIPAAVVRAAGVEYSLSVGSARDPFTPDLPHFVSVALPA
jgi:hypothetical protein